MAVPEQTPYIEHTGNGVTTSFSLKFQCESKDHLIVLVDEIEPPVATWSLTEGNVVFTTAPAAGKKITAQRNTPFSRNVDYQSYNNSFRPPAVNKDFDWIWWKLQELGVADWILGARIDALKNYVDRKDDELKAYLMEEIRKQGVALDQLDEYYNYLMERLAQIAVDKGWDSSFVVHDGFILKDLLNDQAKFNNDQILINENQASKNSLSVDILDYIPKSQWGAIFNKISAYDCSSALEQAIKSGLEVKVSRSGLYVFKTAKEYTTDIKITAEAPDVWFDFSQVPAAQVGLKNSGSATLLVSAFASLITEGDRSITLPDVSTLQAGDTLCFYNPTDFSFSGYREYYRDGEFLKIQQIVGNVVYFTNPIKSSYASSSIDIYKLNLKNVVLRDIKVRYYTPFANGVGGIGALRFDFCDFKSYNFYAEAQSSQVLALSRCPNPKLYNTNGFNLGIPAFGGGGLEYFVLFGNCQDWRMYGGDIYSQRHAVAQGGGNAICSIPVSGKAYDLTTRNYFSTSVGSFDAHGNVRECKLVNCTIYNSAKFAGSGVVYEGCKIYASQGGRIAFATEFKGGRHGLIDCELFSYASPRNLSHSYFDFGSNTDVITDKTSLDTEIFILNTKATLRNASALDHFARVFNRGGSKKININFDNIEFNSDAQINCVLRIEKTNVAGNTAVADSDYIIVDNIFGKNSPIPIIHGTSDYQQFPHRLPVIRGVKRATTTASATVPVTGVAYGYTLPKRPFLQLNIAGADGAALSTLGGQSLFVPVVSAPGLTTFNASINAAAAFTAGAEFDLQYTASIREC